MRWRQPLVAPAAGGFIFVGMVVRALRHRATQKRRLFAGKNQVAYNRELRMQRLAAGKIHQRRLFAGQVGIAYHRELRAMRLGQGRGTPRRLFSHDLKGEFSGFVKDPAVRRTPRRSRATGKARRLTARQLRYLHSRR